MQDDPVQKPEREDTANDATRDHREPAETQPQSLSTDSQADSESWRLPGGRYHVVGEIARRASILRVNGRERGLLILHGVNVDGGAQRLVLPCHGSGDYDVAASGFPTVIVEAGGECFHELVALRVHDPKNRCKRDIIEQYAIYLCRVGAHIRARRRELRNRDSERVRILFELDPDVCASGNVALRLRTGGARDKNGNEQSEAPHHNVEL